MDMDVDSTLLVTCVFQEQNGALFSSPSNAADVKNIKSHLRKNISQAL